MSFSRIKYAFVTTGIKPCNPLLLHYLSKAYKGVKLKIVRYDFGLFTSQSTTVAEKTSGGEEFWRC